MQLIQRFFTLSVRSRRLLLLAFTGGCFTANACSDSSSQVFFGTPQSSGATAGVLDGPAGAQANGSGAASNQGGGNASSGGTNSGGSNIGGSSGAGKLGDGLPGVPCGGVRCSLGTACCHDTCSNDPVQCELPRRMCDGPEDCPGQICCVSEVELLDGSTNCQDICLDHRIPLCSDHATCSDPMLCMPSGDAYGSQTCQLVYCEDVTTCPDGTNCEEVELNFGARRICVN